MQTDQARLNAWRVHRWWTPVRCGTLILALLFAQSLGLLHRAAHGQAIAEPQSPLQGLFDAHDRASPACGLYDQLSHADLLPTALAGAPVHAVPCASGLRSATPGQRAAEPAHFLARAPPLRS